MRGYDREELHPEMEDGYDDYDDDDGYGQEEEEEEDPQPSKEELEYLELRQRLKERIRNKNKKGGGSALNNSNDRKRKLPNDNYGSFFGPSQPVISQRVIEQSKSLLETQHLTPKVSNSFHPNKKSAGSSSSGSKHVVHDKKTKVLNEVRSKVHKIKQTRDYSFLLSDDAELPAPPKVAPQRNIPIPSAEARPSQVPLKSKQRSVTNGRHVNGGHGERKPLPTMNGHMNSKTESNKLPSTSRANSISIDSRRMHSSNNGTGPGRPLASKGVPSKVPASAEKKDSASFARSSVSSTQKPPSSKSHPPSRSQHSSRSQPSAKTQLPTSKSQPPPKLQHSSQLQPSVSRQQMDRRRELQEPTKARILPKQPAGLSRPQMKKPVKQFSSRDRSPDNRPKKKPMRRYSDDEDDDGEAAISMIRKMFRYNPNKFADRDDDLSDMEANFDDIMREEQLSAKIARKEDEEQLRLIEAEERRERLAKLKRQKRR